MRTDKKPFPDHVEDKHGVLFFTGVKHSDVGSYTCEARSSQGIINITIHVDVVGMFFKKKFLLCFWYYVFDMQESIGSIEYVESILSF